MNDLNKIRWARVALLSSLCIASSTLLGTLSALAISRTWVEADQGSLAHNQNRMGMGQVQADTSLEKPTTDRAASPKAWKKWSQLQRKTFVVPKVQSRQKVSKVSLLRPGETQIKLIDIDIVDRDLRAVCEEIGRKVGRNILVDRGVEESITLTLRDIHWTEALEIVAQLTRCEITMGPGEVILLKQPPHVTLEFSDANIRTVLMLLAAYTGKNIVIDPSIQGRVTLSLKDVHWEKAIQAICTVHGQFEIFEDKDGEILIAQRVSGKHRR